MAQLDRQFYVYLDSGAGAYARHRAFVTLSDIGFTSEQWDALSEKARDDVMRDIAFELGEWGWYEVSNEPDNAERG